MRAIKLLLLLSASAGLLWVAVLWRGWPTFWTTRLWAGR
jgi:hypothetical protein